MRTHRIGRKARREVSTARWRSGGATYTRATKSAAARGGGEAREEPAVGREAAQEVAAEPAGDPQGPLQVPHRGESLPLVLAQIEPVDVAQVAAVRDAEAPPL